MNFWLRSVAIAALAAVVSFGFAAGGHALDAASVECFKCHEGVERDGSHAGGGHSAGVLYAGALQERAKLKSASLFPPEIKLAEGRLSCITCHAPYSKTSHAGSGPMLVMGNDRSALCLACHDM